MARLLSLLWRGYQICGEITLWRGYSQVTGDSPIYCWNQQYFKNKKYGNFVSISSLTGKCTAQKLKKLLQFYSIDMFTLYGHINNPK